MLLRLRHHCSVCGGDVVGVDALSPFLLHGGRAVGHLDEQDAVVWDEDLGGLQLSCYWVSKRDPLGLLLPLVLLDPPDLDDLPCRPAPAWWRLSVSAPPVGADAVLRASPAAVVACPCGEAAVSTVAVVALVVVVVVVPAWPDVAAVVTATSPMETLSLRVRHALPS